MKQSKSKKSTSSHGSRPKTRKGVKKRVRKRIRTKSVKYKKSLKPLVIAVISLVVLTVIFIMSSFIYSNFSDSGVALEVTTETDSVVIGLPHDVGFTISNDSDNLLNDTSLSLRLPENVVFASGDNRRVTSIDIGDINPGEIIEEKFNVILLPDESGTRELDATLSYSFESITAKFEKHEIVSIEAIDFPLDLEFSYPEEVLSGQDFEVGIKYENTFDRILPAFRLVLDSPDVFLIDSTEPELEDDRHWPIDSLPVSGSGELSVMGKTDLPGGSEFSLGFSVILDLGGFSYEVLTDSIEIPVVKSPLSIEISSLGNRNSDKNSYELSETVVYSVAYQNNTDEPIRNARVEVVLDGEMFDFDSLASEEGNINIGNGTIVWESDNVSELKLISPDDGGELSFTVDIVDSYDIRRINDRNYTVRADAKIEANGMRGINSIESKIIGRVEIESLGYFRDAESMILNEGPFPPIVGMPTEYTIHWRLTNFATDISDIVVSAPLANNVTFTGEVNGDGVNFEDGRVVWNLGKMSATTGITSKKPEIVFQVRAIPDSSMKGNYMDLLGETTVSANDEFTDSKINSNTNKTTTRLEGDSTVDEDDGKVQ